MTQTKLQVGIVGTGFGRTVQIPGFQHHPETEVVAVCSHRRERAEAVAAEFGIAHALDDYQAMLALPGLDVVSIVTPPYLHHDMALAALEAGKHVLCEKPMAMDAGQAERMTRKAQEAGRVAMIDFEFRFIPNRTAFKEFVAEGYLGALQSITALWTSSFLSSQVAWGWLSEKSKGGGAMGGSGSHAIDHLLWWFGDIERCLGRYETLVKERQVSGSAEVRAVETEDWLAAILDFKNGGRGVLNVNATAGHNTGNAVEAYGTQGSLVIDKAGRLLGAQRGASLGELPIPARLLTPPGAAQGVRSDFLWLVERLVRAIRDGGDPGPSFGDGLRCQRVIDAIARSSNEGRPILA